MMGWTALHFPLLVKKLNVTSNLNLSQIATVDLYTESVVGAL